MAVPFVLAVAADSWGCGAHRCQFPAYWITKSGAALANSVLGYPSVEDLVKMAPTAIICQRPRDEAEIKILARLREDLGNKIKIIYEIDDLLTDVAEANVHEAFQPPPDEVNANIAKALAYCDWAICPTPPLKEWLQGLRPSLEVKIIPNYVEELDSLENLPKIESPPPGIKPNIGWGGSISHDGDLDLIIKTIEEIPAEDCRWVFFGHQPRADFTNKDFFFRPGVPPHEYLRELMKENLELILAPIEENAFNDAKSNLKLVQAGAIGAAVIASPYGPYLRNNPPVFAYAKTPEEWLIKTQEWLKLPPNKKIYHRARMRKWAKENFGVKKNIYAILSAWGISNGRLGESARGKTPGEGIIVVGDKDSIQIKDSSFKLQFEADIERAAKKAIRGNQYLFIAMPGSVISNDSLKLLVEALKSDPDAASACSMSNDGGIGFSFLTPPSRPAFAPLDSQANSVCEKVCKDSKLEKRNVAFPLGPVALLSPKALASLPQPSPLLWDWGFLAAIGGKKNLFVPQSWAFSPQPANIPPGPWIEIRGLNIPMVQGALSQEERVKLECNFIRESESFLVGSAPGDAATWAEIFVPEDENLIAEDVKVIKFGSDYELGGINEAYIRFEGKDLEVRKGADWHMLQEANKSGPNFADIVYCDALAPNGSHFFKPNKFDRELFFGIDYLSACSLIKVEALKEINSPNIVNQAQLYGVILEMIKVGKKIIHCPKPLYWEKGAIDDEIKLGMIKHTFPEYAGKQIMAGAIQTHRKLNEGNLPSVSIIMLTAGRTWTLRQCLATLLKRTEYPGEWNLFLGRSGPRRGDPTKLEELKNSRVSYFELGEGEFNWSRFNNELAAKSSADIYVFLNDDVLITDKHWLEHMVAQAQREDVGAVGLRLYFPNNGALQHAGVYVGDGIAGHILKNTPGNWPGYWGYGRLTHEATAITGAAMAIKRKDFEEAGGFDEQMAVNYSDVDICLKLLKMGLKNICVCSAEMMHQESSSRPLAMTEEWIRQISREGKKLAENHPNFADPYWPPPLKVAYTPNKWSLGGLNFDIMNWDRPWAGAALILNDKSPELVIQAARGGLKPIIGMVEHGRLALIKPGLMNAPVIEIIEKSLIKEIFEALGIKSVRGEGVACPEGKILLEVLAGMEALKADGGGGS